jgi:acyl carrier protein
MDSNSIFDFILSSIKQISEGDIAVDGIDPQSSWFDISLDSIQIMGLAGLVETEFGIEISEDTLFENQTISDFVAYISGEMLSKGSSVCA